MNLQNVEGNFNGCDGCSCAKLENNDDDDEKDSANCWVVLFDGGVLSYEVDGRDRITYIITTCTWCQYTGLKVSLPTTDSKFLMLKSYNKVM